MCVRIQKEGAKCDEKQGWGGQRGLRMQGERDRETGNQGTLYLQLN